MIDLALLFLGVSLGVGLPGIVIGYLIGTARCKVNHARNADL